MNCRSTSRARVVFLLSLMCVVLVVAFVGCGRIGGGYDPDLASDNSLKLSGSVLLPNNVANVIADRRTTGADPAVRADGQSGFTPVANAMVWIEELPEIPAQVTDASGTYSFTGLPSGKFRVVAKFLRSGKTFKTRSEPTEPQSLVASQPNLSMVLAIAAKIVTGVLRDATGAVYPPGTVLTLWGEKFYVQEDGKFTSPELPNDVIAADITVFKTGVTQQEQPKVTVQFYSAEGPTTVEVQVGGNDTQYKPISGTVTVKRNGKLVSADNVISTNDLVDLALSLTNIDKNFPGITFEWDAGRGRFSTPPGNSDIAVWVAPATSGMATISVKIGAPNRGFCKVLLPIVVDVPLPVSTGTGTGTGTETGSGTATSVVTGTGTGTGTTTSTATATSTGSSTGTSTGSSTGTLTGSGTGTGTGTIATFTMSFNSQGGSAVASQTVNQGEKATAPTTPTRTGYTFAGWYKDAATTTIWDFSSDMVSQNVTLYAKWIVATTPTFTLSFDSQGGTPIDVRVIEQGATTTVPMAPTRTNYTFGGWYKEAGCVTAWTFGTDTITQNTILYAKWTIITRVVSFDALGGSTVPSQTVSQGATTTAPIAPTRAGFTFGGWYKESGCVTAWNFATDAVTQATTLFAKWTIITRVVSFDALGGSTVPSQTVSQGATTTAPIAPTRAGFTFGGWYKDAATITVWNFSSDTVSQDVTLFARWIAATIPTFTVSFNSQGGTAIDARIVEQNATLTAPLAPTLASSTFAGWYRESACTTTWTFASDVVTASTTLYARWTHALTYSTGVGGSVSGVLSQTVDHWATGTAVTAVASPGYHFVSWSDGLTSNPRTDSTVIRHLTVQATFAPDSGSFSTTNNYAWSENAGWINFTATGGQMTAQLGANGFLTGNAWSENVGWIRFAAASAVAPYANTTTANWGVNLDTAGKLSGYAWSENAGWINFSATNANAAFDLSTKAISGYAWSENLGWMKFSGTTYGVQLAQ